MRGQRLNKGMHIIYSGREYTIEKRLPSGDLQLKNIITEKCEAIAEKTLIEALFAGDAQLIGESREYSNLSEKQRHNRINDISALDDNDPRKIMAKRRLAYVIAVVKADITKFTEESLATVIDKASKEIGDSSPPSHWSVYRWLKDYLTAGEDMRALVPATKAKGNRTRKISNNKEHCETIIKIIDVVIREEYLSLERPTVETIYSSIEDRIITENRYRANNDKLLIPHRSTVYRIIKKLDPYERDVARLGKRIADARHKAIKQGPRPTRPLERVECDDTKLDLFIYDHVRQLPLGRPWIITLIDVYTKMVLGFFLSFVPPSYLSAMQCLLHAIRPKTYVKEKYPDIVNEWDTYGIMETLVVDNAKHWYSASFEEACLQIGITVQYAPPQVPWFKGTIERFFNTVNKRLLNPLPGKTFSNILEKGDYNPKKHALVSLEMFEKIFHHWIIDIYHQSKHRGINDVPVRLWKIGIDKYPPPLPPKNTELEILLGHIVWRVISAAGVELFGLYYNDLILASVRNNLKKGQKVKIKYDPNDLSLIYVYDQYNNRYLPVPAVDQVYTQGLTHWQHNVIRRYARLEVADYVDIVHLTAAKERIKKMIRDASNKLQKSGTNVKVGRWISNEQKGRRGTVESVANNADDLRQGNSSICGNYRPNNDNHTTGISDFSDIPHSTSNADNVEIPPRAALRQPSDKRKSKTVSNNGDNRNKKSVTHRSQPKSRKDNELDQSDWDFDYT